MKLAPSILAADLGRLREEIAEVAGLVDSFHIDVMDGHFVPNISIGPPVVNALRDGCTTPFNIHLMITDPARYIDSFLVRPGDTITFHIEVVADPRPLIAQIKRAGARGGLSLKPRTPVEAVFDLLPEADLVLVMSVEPGFGGQEFLPDSLERIRLLRREIDRRSLAVEIAVDGGVNEGNIREIVAAGADVIVAGTAIFGQRDRRRAVAALRQAAGG
ncbi:MAG: ribulose-phosphate 3-epimerase [Candidatus Acetothermia bacterium]|jgi:ribulose-phosphate 3-epimerase|nr:ribulose-phosphate 3-epimerase [Candidatus Acetothermia bacterium]MDH7505521.1 ribulose-phosphate 3-epimerase [Candidatus Acetothermia bacterium]